ncbi:MAG TPA: hypothetical protein VG406_20165 [Isosphaeraceae bacterium]|jgi:uncharacterized protein YwgA|nr:hypothetical protein [Isosphaeraceae bacterium]
MKLIYFLQTVKNVPLNYNFSLYVYGPYDPEVLDDLAYAQSLGALDVRVESYKSGGYGFEIQPGPAKVHFKALAKEFLDKHRDHIDWVLREFGEYSPARLELASTMVFIDREAVRSGERLRRDDLVRRVLEIKPRFSLTAGYEQARELEERHLLSSIVPPQGGSSPMDGLTAAS